MKWPSGQHPRRRTPRRAPLPVVRVLAEGKVTEPRYLTEWARRNRSSVHLDIAVTGKTPMALVHQARQAQRQRRRRGGPQDFDEIWVRAPVGK